MAREVRATESSTVAASIGQIVRRSTTSIDTVPASFSATSSASVTPEP